MRTITVTTALGTEPHTYIIPSLSEAMRHSRNTWGKQHDPIERRVVEGGLPIVMQRVQRH